MLAGTRPIHKAPAARKHKQSYEMYDLQKPHTRQMLAASDRIQAFVIEVIRIRQDNVTQSKDFTALGQAYIAVSTLDREIRVWHESLPPELSRSALTSSHAPALLFLVR